MMEVSKVNNDYSKILLSENLIATVKSVSFDDDHDSFNQKMYFTLSNGVALEIPCGAIIPFTVGQTVSLQYGKHTLTVDWTDKIGSYSLTFYGNDRYFRLP